MPVCFDTMAEPPNSLPTMGWCGFGAGFMGRGLGLILKSDCGLVWVWGSFRRSWVGLGLKVLTHEDLYFGLY